MTSQREGKRGRVRREINESKREQTRHQRKERGKRFEVSVLTTHAD